MKGLAGIIGSCMIALGAFILYLGWGTPTEVMTSLPVYMRLCTVATVTTLVMGGAMLAVWSIIP